MLFRAPARLPILGQDPPRRPDPTGLLFPLHVCVLEESTTWQSVTRERDPLLPREIYKLYLKYEYKAFCISK